MWFYDVSEFDVFDDPCCDAFDDTRLSLTSKNNMESKEITRGGPSFSCRDGFLPSPSNVRVCSHLLIVESSKLKR